MVCERLTHLLKLKGLNIAKERASHPDENFLLCRAIAQVESTEVGLMEGEKRLSRINRIWLSFVLAQKAALRGDVETARALMKRAQNVVSNHSISSKANDNTYRDALGIEQHLLRVIAYARMEIGDKAGAISAIKLAQSYFSFRRTFWHVCNPLAFIPYAYDPISLTLWFTVSATEVLKAWLLSRASREGRMHQLLHEDLEALEADQQINVTPSPLIRLDPQDEGLAKVIDPLLIQGKFHRVMQQAMRVITTRLLIFIATSPHKHLHPDDPYYRKLFPPGIES